MRSDVSCVRPVVVSCGADRVKIGLSLIVHTGCEYYGGGGLVGWLPTL